METDFQDILKEKLSLEVENALLKKLAIWEREFIEYNNHTNLMSKNDIKYLYQKHVFDSLSIFMWDGFKKLLNSKDKKILDVGTGGGFPSVILSIFFPDIKITANDSRIKKINFIKHIKEVLKLDNLEILYSRIEEIKPVEADLIVSRAVGKICDVFELSKKHLKKEGAFLFYKSKLYQDEIKTFEKKYKKAAFEIIPYDLPLEESFERNLVVLKF